MGMRNPLFKISIMLESNPLKPKMLVGGLGVIIVVIMIIPEGNTSSSNNTVIICINVIHIINICTVQYILIYIYVIHIINICTVIINVIYIIK